MGHGWATIFSLRVLVAVSKIAIINYKLLMTSLQPIHSVTTLVLGYLKLWLVDYTLHSLAGYTCLNLGIGLQVPKFRYRLALDGFIACDFAFSLSIFVETLTNCHSLADYLKIIYCDLW